MEIHQPDDRFFDKIMRDKKNVRSLLEEQYPNIAKLLDLDSLQFDGRSFLRPNLKSFKSDIIYRVRFKNDKEELHVTLIWEHKSEVDELVCIQLGLYIFLAMYALSKESKKVQLVLPFIFYNGKKPFEPKTIHQLVENHPHYADFKTYLPDFNFLFKDITRESEEKILAIKNEFLRRALFAMSNRFRPNLLMQKLYIIFGEEEEDKLILLATYFLGIIERSPKEFQKEVDQLDWPIKNKVMSTLDMLLQQGEARGVKKGIKQGMEKGLLLQSLSTFFKTIKTFPNTSRLQLAEVLDIEIDVVDELLLRRSNDTAESILEYIKNRFQDITFTKEDLDKLRELIHLAQV